MQILDALIRNQRAQQREPPQILHARQSGHGLVGDVSVAEVQIFQVHERDQALGILHRAEGHAQILELTERRYPHQSRVPEIQPGERGQPRLEPFQMLHAREKVKHFVGIRRLNVAGRTPHARGNE